MLTTDGVMKLPNLNEVDRNEVKKAILRLKTKNFDYNQLDIKHMDSRALSVHVFTTPLSALLTREDDFETGLTKWLPRHDLSGIMNIKRYKIGVIVKYMDEDIPLIAFVPVSIPHGFVMEEDSTMLIMRAALCHEDYCRFIPDPVMMDLDSSDIVTISLEIKARTQDHLLRKKMRKEGHDE